MRKLCFILSLVLCFSFPLLTSAEEVYDVSNVEEFSETTEHNIVVDWPDEPIYTIQITEEDYLASQSVQPYVTGSAYQGSINSTALNYFTGVMLNNLGSDYVVFRGSQYDYYLFWGDEITYSNGRFSGSGLSYISYNQQSGTFDRGTDSLSINHNNTVVYSNVNNSFANLVEVKYCEETRAAGIITASVFVLLCILWLFKR